MHLLKQSTATTVLVGPVLDSTGAAYTGLAVTDLKFTKNGTVGAPNASATLTHDHNGHYLLALTTSDTDTLGRFCVSCNKATYAMSEMRYEVLTAATFDAIITNAAGTASGLPILDVNALVDADAKRVGGTTQTGRDIGASVLLSAGTGTGQLDFTSGVVKANLVQILAAAVTGTAANIVAAFTKFFDKASPTGTVNSLPDAVAGAAGGVAIVGSVMGKSPATLAAADVTGNLPVDLQTIKTQAVTAAAPVTVPASIGTSTYAGGAVASVTGDVGGKVIGGGVSSITGVGAQADVQTIKGRAITDPGGTVAVGTNVAQVGSQMDLVSAPNATALSAIGGAPWDALRSAHTNVNTYGGHVVADFVDAPNATALLAIANALLDAVDAIETGLTPRQSLRLVSAALAGVLSGAATTTVTIKGAGVGTTRIQAVVDSDGNRSALTLTP